MINTKDCQNQGSQLLAPDEKKAVKELLGTCVSIGVTVR